MKRGLFTVLCLIVIAFAAVSDASAAIIGNWSGSSRSWNTGDMSILKSTLIADGDTVLPDSAITAGILSDDVFVIGEPLTAPTGGEISTLSTFVNTGGILLLFNDSGFSGGSANNTILAGIGSSMTVLNSSASVAPFPVDGFATNNDFNLVGQTLGTSPGMAISGGTAIAGSFISYQQLGSGFVFVFGDRSDHNTFNPTAPSVNGQLFLNITDGPAGEGPTPVPEPATLLLVGSGIATTIIRRRRRG
jgi:PEP-CTERM motif